MDLHRVFSRFASQVAQATGKPLTFVLCLSMVVFWAVMGPVFGFSDTWQLVINTGTTILTFLQVFLIQNTQNRDSAAIQVKLDELLRASNPRTKFIGIEDLTEEELTRLKLLEGVQRRQKPDILKRGKRTAKGGAKRRK